MHTLDHTLPLSTLKGLLTKMEDILTRKYKKNEIVKKKNDYLAAIDSEEATFRKVVLKDQKITNARLFYAASKINALVRGFLDRQLCKRLLRKLRAVKVIQRLIRGKLGRIRWQREYWKQLSVVKSPEALEEILKRSTIVREKFFHEKLVKYHWQEQYDPLTECFWYYNPLNKRNTWQVPYCFQQELICTWEGYRSFGGVNAKPCRCIFGNRQEYYNHMRFAHKWSCVACYSPNSGINFPNCSVCHNRYNEDGIDGESVLKESVKKVNAKISNFLYKDMKYSAFIDQYNLKTRLTDIAGFYKDVFEPMLQEEIEQSDDDSVSLNDMEKMHERQLRLMGRSFDELHKKKVKVIDLIASNMLIRNSKSREGRKTAGSPSSKRRPGSRAKNKLPAIPGVTVQKGTKSTSPSRAMTPGKSSKPSGGAMAELSRQISERISRSRSRSPSRGMSRSASRPMTGRSGHLFGADYLNEIEEPMETAFLLDGNYDGTKIVKSELDNAMSTGDFYDVDKKSHRTVNQEVMARAWKAIGGYEGEEQLTRDPVLNGVFSDEMFNIITSIHSDDIHSRILKGMMFGGDEDNEEDMKSAKKRRTGGGGYDSQDDDNSSVGSVGEGSVGSLSDVSDGEGGSLEDDFSQLNLSKQQARKKKKKSKDDEKGMKLLVCPNFIDGNCSSTTCLLAHPGMRDNAQIYIKTTRNEDGSRKRIPYVYICPLTDGADLMMCRVSKLPEPIALGPDSKVPKAKKKKDSIDSLPSIPPVDDQSQEAISMPIKKNQKKDKSKPPPKPPVPEEVPERLRYRHVCSLGKQCTSYHVYVRPSTEEIILAMYPIRCGHRTKLFPDGSKLIGNVRNDKFNGYATMLWENGDVYMGDWQDDQRHGFGIYRNKDGSMEYIGQFAYGVRSGWGLLRTKNGDEYVGQWKNGKMHGVGILISSTVDQPGQSVDAEFRKDALVGKTVYHGEFKDNLYDGIGVFQRSNGDVYMGYCQGGKAHGLGILSLSTGEKYKGHFERNARHGKGCCAYPNGSRYAGTWYRGVHSGYGIYISPEGEKYIGEWDGGKKHGKGRYLFLNHDFYDGEFFKNKAKGVGVYYHANGNLYSGQWVSYIRCSIFLIFEYSNFHFFLQ